MKRRVVAGLPAIVLATARRGFVFGSIDHDTWKSGVTAQGRKGKLDRLGVTAGLTDYSWFDQSVHTGLQAFHKGMRQVVGWAGQDTVIYRITQ